MLFSNRPLRGDHPFYMKYRMTEHNIFDEIKEDMERQKWEALWKNYGNYVLFLAVAIVLATAGFTVYHSWRTEKNQNTTAALMEIMKGSDNDRTKQIAALEAFAEKNHGDTQAAFAELHAADFTALSGNKEKAVQIYDTVAGDRSVDLAFRQLADLLSIQLQMDTAPAAVLEKRLQPLLAENAPWRFTAMEFEGYLAYQSGDKEKAKQVFTELAQNASAPQTLAARANDMLRYVSE